MADVSAIRSRVARVLLDLELISEAPAARAFDAPLVKGGGGGSGDGLHGPGSLLEFHAGRLEEWLIRAENDRDRHKFRPPSREPESPAEWGDRIVVQYGVSPQNPDGVHDLAVAEREKASRAAVRKAREQRGFEPLMGRPRVKASQ
jgi:hypothetical protein